MKKSWFLLLFLFVILISLNCAKKEQRFVAVVGDEKITVDEFNLKLRNRVRQIPPTREDELTLRKNVLERCVQEKLLAQAAKEMGRDQDEIFINAVKEREENFLVQELYNREVLEKSEPTERELKEFYKKQAEEIHARQILLKSRSKAEEVYQRLKEGANFEELAKQESEDAATRDKGGDLGFFQWGKAVGPFQDAAFKLKPQEISKPVKTPFGWHIIKLEERRAVEQPEFETVRENLENTLRTFKQQELSYTFIEDLRRKSDFKVNSTTLRLLIEKAEKPEDTLQAKATMVAEFDPAKFTAEEKDLVLGSFKGGELGLGAFLDNYHMIPAFRRPSLDEELLGDLIYQMSLKPILIQVARDRKIDESDGYLNSLNDFKDMTLANGYQSEVLWKDVSSTEEEVKDYYERNKDLYLSPPTVKVKEIMVKTEPEAEKLLQELKAGGDWDKLAMERTLRSHVRSRGGDLGFVNEKIYPEIFNYALNNMKIGEIGGPVHIKESRYGEGYSVVKFLDKKDAYQRTLAEVRKDVETRLMNEKKSKALEDWIAEVKKEKEVKTFEDVLESTVEAKE